MPGDGSMVSYSEMVFFNQVAMSSNPPRGTSGLVCPPDRNPVGLLPKRSSAHRIVFLLLPFTTVLFANLMVLGCRPVTPNSDISVSEEETGPSWFEDITDAVGLDFVHDPGPVGTYFMPQSMGSGAAFIHELGPDGNETHYLYLLQNAGPNSKSVNRLYKQLPNGTFHDVDKRAHFVEWLSYFVHLSLRRS